MPLRTRFPLRIFVIAMLAACSCVVGFAPTASADSDSLSLDCENDSGGPTQCDMAIPQLRVVPADHKIDWGASDYHEADGNKANQAANENTLPYTTGQLGQDGGPAGTADDYPTTTSTGGAQAVTGAGAHPFLNAFIRYCDEHDKNHLGGFTCPLAQSRARIRSLTLKLPPGMIGNPQASPPCPWAIIMLGAARTICPDSVVGVVRNWVTTSGNSNEQAAKDLLIYNTERVGGEPARFASDWEPTGYVQPLPIVFAARQRDGDVGIDSFTDDIPSTWGTSVAMGKRQHLKVMEQDITLFRRVPVKVDPNPTNLPYVQAFEEQTYAQPFFTNPTSCGHNEVELEARSWEEGPGVTSSHATRSDSFETTGCDNPATRPDFDRPNSDPLGADSPEVKVEQDPARDGSDEPGKPTAFNITVRMPDTENSAIHGTHLKNAKVTLPEGITLAPGAGDGLEGCDADQFRLDDPDAAVSCPPGSRIAGVEVDTPLLPSPIGGAAYFATPDDDAAIPTEDHPWKLFLLIEGQGNRIKLAGDVSIDQGTGQITTNFENNPQVPFRTLTLRMNGGNKSILQNPTGCGPNQDGVHEGSAELEGWSGDTKNLTPTVTVDEDSCTDDPPFQPSVSASADDESAGASSPSHLGVERPDGQARMEKLQLALPAGLVGSLTTVPLCSAADVPKGTCPDSTKIGTVTTTLGYGDATLDVPGSLYLGKGTEPGDAAALSAVIPSKIGPIDFGNVVVVNHIKLRQFDGGLTATTDEVKKIPTIVGGIPIYAKKIKIDVDRPGFLTNPTGCDVRQLIGDFDSDNAKHATASVNLTSTNCDRLPFGPKLEMTALGEYGRFQHPGLKAVVTQTPGQAAIKQAVVLLPETLRPELPTIQKSLCTTPQLNANACPPASIVGDAVAHTPLLPEPLSGPVFLVQDPNINDPLPKIVVRLAGMVSIDLSARNTIQGVRTVNTFASIPDVPVTSFALNIKGGKPGILKNFYDICDRPSRADATFTGQNGKVHVTRPLLLMPGCIKGQGVPTIETSTATMSKKGVVAIKVQCGTTTCSNGKVSIQTGGASTAKTLGSKGLSISSGETATIKVKLSKSARRSVVKRKKLTAKTVVTVGQTNVSKKLTIRAPKKKKKRR